MAKRTLNGRTVTRTKIVEDHILVRIQSRDGSKKWIKLKTADYLRRVKKTKK